MKRNQLKMYIGVIGLMITILLLVLGYIKPTITVDFVKPTSVKTEIIGINQQTSGELFQLGELTAITFPTGKTEVSKNYTYNAADFEEGEGEGR